MRDKAPKNSIREQIENMCLWGPSLQHKPNPSMILAPLANCDQMQESLNTSSNNNSEKLARTVISRNFWCMCKWFTSCLHFNQKHRSWQLIILRMTGGDPSGKNILYHISLLTSVHPIFYARFILQSPRYTITHLSTHAKYCFVGGPIHSS